MKTRFTLLVCFAALLLPAKLLAAGLSLVDKASYYKELDYPDPFIYTVKTTGGTPKLNYAWQSKTTLTFQNDSTIIYTPSTLGLDTIYCTVSDQIGASVKQRIVFKNWNICAPHLRFEDLKAFVGDTVTASLYITNVTAKCEYNNFIALLTFDTTKLSFVDITNKNSLMPHGEVIADVADGKSKDNITFAEMPSFEYFEEGYKQDGIMLNLRFVATNKGTSPLNMSIPDLNGIAPLSMQNGSVTITEKPSLHIKPDTAFVSDTLTTYISVSNLDPTKKYTNFESSILFDTTALRFVDASMKNTRMPNGDLLAEMNDTNSVYVGFTPSFSNPTESFNIDGNLVQVRFVGKKAGSFKLKLKTPILDGIWLDTTSATLLVKERPVVCNPKISINDQTVYLGDTIIVPLMISNITKECGYDNFETSFAFDTTKLQYVGATAKNTVMPNSYVISYNFNDGTAYVSFGSSFDYPYIVMEGNGSMINLIFTTKRTGTSKITLTTPLLIGRLVTSISLGSITILPTPQITFQAPATCQNDTLRLQIEAKDLFGNAQMSTLNATIHFPASVTYKNYSIANGIMRYHHVTITNNVAGQIGLEIYPSTISSQEEMFANGTLITLLFVAKDSGSVAFSCNDMVLENLSLQKSSNLQVSYMATINDAPNVEIRYTKQCFDPEFQFHPYHMQSQIFTLWTLPDGTSKETARLFTTQEGIYTFMQRNDAGCQSSDTAYVSFIYPNGNANFTVSETDTVRARYLFVAETDAALQWSLPDKSTNTNKQFDRHFTTALLGDVCVTTSGTNQCPLTKCKTLSFKPQPTLYTINGTVSDVNKQKVAARVVAYYLRGSEYVAIDSVQTSDNGTFIVTDLPKGNYTLCARPTNETIYKTSYFYDASTIDAAEKFSLTGNGTNFDIKMLSALTALSSSNDENGFTVTVNHTARITAIKSAVVIDEFVLVAANGQVIERCAAQQNCIEFKTNDLNAGVYLIAAVAKGSVVAVEKLILP